MQQHAPRTVAQVMADEGVDLSDPDAVSRWMEKCDELLAEVRGTRT
jgi:hypothetical protein